MYMKLVFNFLAGIFHGSCLSEQKMLTQYSIFSNYHTTGKVELKKNFMSDKQRSF